VKNADDLYRTFANTIDGKIWQATEDEFACVRVSTCSAVFRKFCKQVDLVVDRKRDTAGSPSATMLFNVIANLSEIANGSVRLADAH
jgi:hypothetical protein